jgi:ABC-type antimicrobial peptide transport system permease subunit
MALPLVYSLRSVAVRKSASAMAVGGIALVVLVFVFLLAMGEGLRRAVATSGSPHNLIVIRKGSEAELNSQVLREDGRVVEQLPQVARDAEGRPLFLYEAVTILARPKKGGGMANLTIRGTASDATRVHEEARLAAGRWFRAGAAEVVAGVALTRRAEGFSLGQTVCIKNTEYRIVGVLEAGGSGLESEIWMDHELFILAFRRQGTYTSFLFRAAGEPLEAKRRVEEAFAADLRLRSLQVMTEEAYYAKQSELMSTVITVLAGILTAIMSVGAIVGAMNTMYAAVSHRQREIGCLLALGFTPEAVWLTFIIESVALSLIGAGLGALLSLFFHGMRTGTTNWMTFAETAFTFEVTPRILLTACVVAVGMGFFGGFLPAFRAARMKVVDALRRA